MDRQTYEQFDRMEEILVHIAEQQQKMMEILENQKRINELKDQITKKEV